MKFQVETVEDGWIVTALNDDGKEVRHAVTDSCNLAVLMHRYASVLVQAFEDNERIAAQRNDFFSRAGAILNQHHGHRSESDCAAAERAIFDTLGVSTTVVPAPFDMDTLQALPRGIFSHLPVVFSHPSH